eukprot:7131348-Alexandrium_andersonii.AAC.1
MPVRRRGVGRRSASACLKGCRGHSCTESINGTTGSMLLRVHQAFSTSRNLHELPIGPQGV